MFQERRRFLARDFLRMGVLCTALATAAPGEAMASAHTEEYPGVLEGVNCEFASGWVKKPSEQEESVGVRLYAKDWLSREILSGAAPDAMFPLVERQLPDRETVLGFNIPIISPLKDGKPHRFFVHVQSQGGNLKPLGKAVWFVTRQARARGSDGLIYFWAKVSVNVL